MSILQMERGLKDIYIWHTSQNQNQTSYNNNFRKKYARIGGVYDAAKNKFLDQQPFASWSLDANDDWEAPVTFPAGDQSAYQVYWDEAGQKWTGVKKSDESKWNWDASGLTWVSAQEGINGCILMQSLETGKN